MRAEGFADGDIDLRRSADFRFLGQSYELTLPLSDAPLRAEDMSALGERFFALYETTYGPGTAWKGVPVQLLNYTVTVTGRLERPARPEAPLEPDTAAAAQIGTRPVYLPSLRERREIPVYDDARVWPGTTLSGPAIVDAADTTVFVPPGARAARDALRNYVLTELGDRGDQT